MLTCWCQHVLLSANWNAQAHGIGDQSWTREKRLAGGGALDSGRHSATRQFQDACLCFLQPGGHAA